MANQPISVRTLRQIIRLHNNGYSKKKISYLLGMSRNTVKKYIARFCSLEIVQSDVDTMTDHQLYSLLIYNYDVL